MSEPIAAKCIRTCTTPQHGFVEEGMPVSFEIDTWDVKKYPYLKHFDKIGGHTGKVHNTVEEGIAAKKVVPAPRPQGSIGGTAGPEGAASATTEVVKPLSEMSPDELAAMGDSEIRARAAAKGVELGDMSRADLVIRAIEAEDKASDVFG